MLTFYESADAVASLDMPGQTLDITGSSSLSQRNGTLIHLSCFLTLLIDTKEISR